MRARSRSPDEPPQPPARAAQQTRTDAAGRASTRPAWHPPACGARGAAPARSRMRARSGSPRHVLSANLRIWTQIRVATRSRHRLSVRFAARRPVIAPSADEDITEDHADHGCQRAGHGEHVILRRQAARCGGGLRRARMPAADAVLRRARARRRRMARGRGHLHRGPERAARRASRSIPRAPRSRSGPRSNGVEHDRPVGEPPGERQLAGAGRRLASRAATRPMRRSRSTRRATPSRRGSALNTTSVDIQAALRPAGGAWQAAIDLSVSGWHAYNARVAMDPQGTAIVVWQRFDGANQRHPERGPARGRTVAGDDERHGHGSRRDRLPRSRSTRRAPPSPHGSAGTGPTGSSRPPTRAAGGAWQAPVDLSAPGADATTRRSRSIRTGARSSSGIARRSCRPRCGRRAAAGRRRRTCRPAAGFTTNVQRRGEPAGRGVGDLELHRQLDDRRCRARGAPPAGPGSRPSTLAPSGNAITPHRSRSIRRARTLALWATSRSACVVQAATRPGRRHVAGRRGRRATGSSDRPTRGSRRTGERRRDRCLAALRRIEVRGAGRARRRRGGPAAAGARDPGHGHGRAGRRVRGRRADLRARGSAGSCWTFGDGTTASGPTVTHAYNVAGTFNVNVTVTDTPAAPSARRTRSRSRHPATIHRHHDRIHLRARARATGTAVRVRVRVGVGRREPRHRPRRDPPDGNTAESRPGGTGKPSRRSSGSACRAGRSSRRARDRRSPTKATRRPARGCSYVLDHGGRRALLRGALRPTDGPWGAAA